MSRPAAFALVVLACVSMAGCGARTRLGDYAVPVDAAAAPDVFAPPVDAFVQDAGPPPNDVGSDANRTETGFVCNADASPLVGRICQTTIFGRDANRSCSVSELIDVQVRGPGTLRWECGGTRAEASFVSGGVYRGTRMGHTFSLCTITEFARNDGCLWQTNQRIEGSLDAHLSLSYEEAPVVSDGACIMPCTASATIGAP